MPDLTLINRRVVLSVGTSATTVALGLANIATIRGRMSAFGVTDPLRAELMASTSLSAIFTDSYYREGFVTGSAPAFLPDWTFTRTGAGSAIDASGAVQSFATGIPRITNGGLLVESGATNKALQSQNPASNEWVTVGAAKTSTNNADPFGTATALLLTADGANSGHYVVTTANSETAAFASGDGYTSSAFVKAGTVDRVQLTLPGAAFSQPYANFHLSGSGSVTGSGGSGTGAILALEDGWYLISLTAVATTTATTNSGVVAMIGSGTATRLQAFTSSGNVLISGYQVTSGSLTSYIPTTTAAASRTIDTATWTFTAGSEGGFLIDATTPPAGVRYLLDVDGPAFSVEIYRNGADVVAAAFPPVGSPYAVSATIGSGRVRVFLGWSDGHFYSTINGVEKTSAAKTSSMAGPVTIRAGSRSSGDLALEGYVHEVIAFGILPSLAERAVLTTVIP